ncbi:MAG: DNA recombination protein RmuC, partial [Leeuwenhoekiella sp.]|nr:DNA recombination protein RmuC [Leeuwenhoekiella sp.]
MTESFLFLIITFVALLGGTVLGYFIAFLKQKTNTAILQERINLLQDQRNTFDQAKTDLLKKQDQLQEDKEFFQNELTARNVAFENLQHQFKEKTSELEQLQEKFTKDFEIIANKILDEKSSKFTLQNKENLDTLLKPLQERISSFEKKVEETNKESL